LSKHESLDRDAATLLRGLRYIVVLFDPHHCSPPASPVRRGQGALEYDLWSRGGQAASKIAATVEIQKRLRVHPFWLGFPIGCNHVYQVYDVHTIVLKVFNRLQYWSHNSLVTAACFSFLLSGQGVMHRCTWAWLLLGLHLIKAAHLARYQDLPTQNDPLVTCMNRL
jgi:hypothetical protein